jgi:hypothetical protein
VLAVHHARLELEAAARRSAAAIGTR